MRTNDPKIDLLRALPTFEGASPGELQRLAATADLVSVRAGDLLCRAGQRALETFIVVRGSVDVVAGGTTVASLHRGQIVGELGVIDGEPRSADVVAATDATLLVIHLTAMRWLIETSHAVRTALLRQVAERVRRMDLEGAAAS